VKIQSKIHEKQVLENKPEKFWKTGGKGEGLSGGSEQL